LLALILGVLICAISISAKILGLSTLWLSTV
jgi:hypothetical protein